jgi:hypothetical protein
MYEAFWLHGTDAREMLVEEVQLSERQCRLFAVASCRRVWETLTEASSQRAVEAAERFAGAKIGREELREKGTAAYADFFARGHRDLFALAASTACHWPLAPHIREFCALLHRAVESELAALPELEQYFSPLWGVSLHFAELLREVAGNPFQPVKTEPAWRRWQGGTVVRLAEVIDARSRFGDLPVLADALEEAGCTEPTLLEHLRATRHHCRGCWVLDLVLGKQ